MAIPIVLLMVATAAGGLAQADAQRQAGKQRKFDLERQSDQEQIAAEGEELQRRQQLNDALARGRVLQAISGIKGEGTPESISLASAKNIATSEGAAALTKRLRKSQLLSAGRGAARSGSSQAASTLLSTTASLAQTGAGT